MKKQFSILSIDKGNLTENPNVQDLNLKVQVDENIRFFSVQISEDSKFGFEGGTLSISKELRKNNLGIFHQHKRFSHFNI